MTGVAVRIVYDDAGKFCRIDGCAVSRLDWTDASSGAWASGVGSSLVRTVAEWTGGGALAAAQEGVVIFAGGE